jgi:hypothetical protein
MFIVNHRNPPPPPPKQHLNKNNMKNLTPVELLVNQLPLDVRASMVGSIEQLKALEKEHLIYAYNFQKERPSVNLTAEQYYYETFKQQEQ